MLTQVQNAGTSAVIANYLYDPAKRQRQKNVGGTKTNYYYAGFQRLAEYDGTSGTPGTLLNRYVYGASLDEVLIQITGGGTKTYYHQNHQGSVIATTNSSGNALNRYAYGPYGESAALTGTTHGYTGQRFDAETGLYYYKMRHYSPKIGRFLQADPIGMAGGINLYSYVASRPISAVDTLGLAASDSGGSGSGGSGSGGFGGGSSDLSGWEQDIDIGGGAYNRYGVYYADGESYSWPKPNTTVTNFPKFKSWIKKQLSLTYGLSESEIGDAGLNLVVKYLQEVENATLVKTGLSGEIGVAFKKGTQSIDYSDGQTYDDISAAYLDLAYTLPGSSEVHYAEVKTRTMYMPDWGDVPNSQAAFYNALFYGTPTIYNWPLRRNENVLKQSDPRYKFFTPITGKHGVDVFFVYLPSPKLIGVGHVPIFTTSG